MKLKFLLLLGVVLGLSLSFYSCDNDDEETNVQLTVLLKNTSNGWRQALKYHTEKEIAEFGMQKMTSVYVAKNGTEQADQINNALKNPNCKVIILSPEGVSKTAVEKITAKGIQLILCEEKIVDGYTSYVYTNNRTIGEHAAQYFIDKEVSKIAAFYIHQDKASSDERIAGLKSRISEVSPATQVINCELDQYTLADGKAKMMEIIDDHSIDAIYAQDDEVATGVLEAIREKGANHIKVIIGCGGKQSWFNLIKNTPDISLATTLYTPKMGATCIEVAALLLNGRPVEEEYPMTPKVIHSENVGNEIDSSSPY